MDSRAGREEARALESKEEASGQLCDCQLCVLNLLTFVLLINGAIPPTRGDGPHGDMQAVASSRPWSGIPLAGTGVCPSPDLGQAFCYSVAQIPGL